MLVASPKERISLVDILVDRELQKAVQNPQDGKQPLSSHMCNLPSHARSLVWVMMTSSATHKIGWCGAKDQALIKLSLFYFYKNTIQCTLDAVLLYVCVHHVIWVSNLARLYQIYKLPTAMSSCFIGSIVSSGCHIFCHIRKKIVLQLEHLELSPNISE